MNKRYLPEGILDYFFLMDFFHHYKNPKDKIARMIRAGELIRVKKGLYFLAEKPPERVALANLIYGPSYVSKEYALSMYNLIPEKVETVTSMTTKRSKQFSTPIGQFLYEKINVEQYSVGIRRETSIIGTPYLIATKEKALVDQLFKLRFDSVEELIRYTIEGLRIEKEDASKMKRSLINQIATQYSRNKTIRFLQRWLGKGILR